MYLTFTQVHHYLSWLVLLVLLYAVVKAWIGFTTNKSWSENDSLAGLIMMIAVDVQVLIGIILYGFLSPLTKAAFANFGAAMKNEMLRFYAVEHILVMVIALIVLHIGRKKIKKAASDKSKHKLAALFYTAGLVLILSRIPWDKIIQ